MFKPNCKPGPLGSVNVDEFVYAVTAAEGVILSLFMSNEQYEDKMILSATVTA